MKCPDEILLQKYADGECKSKEHNVVEKHIESCKLCAGELTRIESRIRDFRFAMDSFQSETDSIPEFRLHNYTVKPQNKKSIRLQVIIPLMAAASLALLVWLLPQKHENQSIIHPLPQTSYMDEFDANKPVSKQSITIKVVSPSGEVTESVMH